jgi:hypothetical protein
LGIYKKKVIAQRMNMARETIPERLLVFKAPNRINEPVKRKT